MSLTDYRPLDWQKMPQQQLADGSLIPAIGLGTFGADTVSAVDVQAAVEFAIRIGYRHIDCASVYGNQAEIGLALAKLLKQQVVSRTDLWITSKVWNDMHHDVRRACEQSLKDLGLDYLDLYLVHWPFANSHTLGAAQTARDPSAKPYSHSAYLQTWHQMQALQQAGLVRYIGTSNMSIAKLKLLLRDCPTSKPIANQMELHPHFQQPQLFAYCMQQGITVIGYSPIGAPGRPARDRAPQDTVDTQDPVILHIAQKHNLHPVQVCLKWAIQRGQIPIPFSSKPKNIYSNLQAVTLAPLDEADMAALAQIDKDSRLIKGQVFLWQQNQHWQDLWDLDGVIKQ